MSEALKIKSWMEKHFRTWSLFFNDQICVSAIRRDSRQTSIVIVVDELIEIFPTMTVLSGFDDVIISNDIDIVGNIERCINDPD